MKIGFIGLGIMGSQMAAHLLTAGYELVVHNRTKNKADALLAKGAKWADNPGEVAADAEMIITMLAHPEAVREVALGKNGFLAKAQADSLWMDCSTLHPAFSKEMAMLAEQHGIQLLDAPVAGSKNQAAAAELVFLVGGSAASFAKAQPLMEQMGKKAIHVGANGMGTALKIVVNQQLATSMLAFAEGIALGRSLGLSQEVLFNTLMGGPVVPPYLAAKRSKMESGSYEVEFPLKWIEKDLQMAGQTAYAHQIPMPLTSAAQEQYRGAIRAGYGNVDFSAILEAVSYVKG